MASLGGEHDDGEGLVDEGVGAVLHLAGGVAFGVDVGDFLELERAFEGDGEVDAAAEEEEVAGVWRSWLASCSHWASSGCAGPLRSWRGCGSARRSSATDCAVSMRAADLAELEGEQEERGELGGEGLGGGDADLGAGVGVDGAVGFAGDHGADDVADGDGL